MQLSVGEIKTVKVTYYDQEGQEAKIDGSPRWASSDQTVASVNPGAEQTATVAGVTAGTVQLSAPGDAEFGDGEKLVPTYPFEVIVTEPEAVKGIITEVL